VLDLVVDVVLRHRVDVGVEVDREHARRGRRCGRRGGCECDEKRLQKTSFHV
jgi:hypothetical protein